MKRFLLILLLAYSLSPIANSQDVQRFSERQIIGTARYVGMGGAMTAIGGDPSAVLDNPAGLGLYRRSEISLTLDETIDKTTQVHSMQNSPTQSYTRFRFAAPNISAIWAWGNPQRQRGLIYSNVMLSANRLANFNRDVLVKGEGMGMVSSLCALTNGLEEQYLQDKPWDDVEIGWLSILGYEAYLINPIVDSLELDVMKKYQWTPAVDFTNGSLSVSESGTYDQYTLSWAGNINNQWYLGLSLNIPTLSYIKRTSHQETDRVNSAELKSLYHLSGVGVSGSVGLIFRPIQALRIGASFQTPTVMSLSVQTEGDMYSSIGGQNYEILTPASGVSNTEMMSPLRSSVSVAGQIGNEGLIAVQYDYAHSAEMEDVHTLRIGAEAQACRGLFINAGYVYESSFMKEDPVWMLGYNEIRTDMDYRYTASSQYASVGFGCRGNGIVAQLAYQYRWQTIHQYASEMQLLPFEVGTRTHRIVATLAWRFSDRAQMAYDNGVEQYSYIEPRRNDLTQIRKY